MDHIPQSGISIVGQPYKIQNSQGVEESLLDTLPTVVQDLPEEDLSGKHTTAAVVVSGISIVGQPYETQKSRGVEESLLDTLPTVVQDLPEENL